MLRRQLLRFATPLALLVAITVGQALAADNYLLSVQPAWGGLVKPGLPSELSLRLLARNGGHGRVTVVGSHAIVHTDLAFEAGVPLATRTPLAHDSLAPVSVELETDGRVVRRENLELQVLQTATTVVAVVSPDAPMPWPADLDPPADTRVLHVKAGELPHTSQAYGLLSALLIAESALPALDSRQQEALADYSAGCGRIYLSGLASRAAQDLSAMAGCGGRNFTVLPWQESTGTITLPVESLPTLSTLATLLPAGQDAVLRSVLLFLFGYAVVLLLASRSATTAFTLLTLPVAATVLALVAWSMAGPRIQLASWAEMDSGDPLARFTGLLQVTGMSPRRLVLALPAPLGVPAFGPLDGPAEITIANAGQRLDLHLNAHLMSRHAYQLAGTAPGAPLALASSATRVSVTNQGNTSSGVGILAWRGQRYTVPALVAGQRWSQAIEAEPWLQTPQEQLLRQRATNGGSWLLLPHRVPALQSATGAAAASGWLLIRGANDA